jgi:hypothetical protein
MSNDFMHVDPRRQREFITELNTRCYNVEKTIEILESRMRMLGSDWRDAEYEIFVKQCRMTIGVLKAFIEEGRKVGKQLTEAAGLAETYQKIKL